MTQREKKRGKRKKERRKFRHTKNTLLLDEAGESCTEIQRHTHTGLSREGPHHLFIVVLSIYTFSGKLITHLVLKASLHSIHS